MAGTVVERPESDLAKRATCNVHHRPSAYYSLVLNGDTLFAHCCTPPRDVWCWHAFPIQDDTQLAVMLSRFYLCARELHRDLVELVHDYLHRLLKRQMTAVETPTPQQRSKWSELVGAMWRQGHSLLNCSKVLANLGKTSAFTKARGLRQMLPYVVTVLSETLGSLHSMRREALLASEAESAALLLSLVERLPVTVGRLASMKTDVEKYEQEAHKEEEDETRSKKRKRPGNGTSGEPAAKRRKQGAVDDNEDDDDESSTTSDS